MKVIYSIDLKENVTIENYRNKDRLWNIESSEVLFSIDEESKLQNLKIVFKNLPIKYASKNVVNPYYPKTKYIAYKVATYISNYFLYNSSIEVLDSKEILNQNIEAEPETPEEKSIWNSCKKSIFNELQATISIIGSIDVDLTAQQYTNALAYSHYADGSRNNNIISAYEQYYKIIETFFDEKGQALDNAVSQHAVQFNHEFAPQFVCDLRQIRNRCVHAQHNRGHITSYDLCLLNLISRKIEDLKKLSRCLIDNPII